MSRDVPRFCRSCGVEVPPTGRFCASCGSSLSLTTPYSAPDVQRQPVAAEQFSSMPSPAASPTVGGSVRLGFGIAIGMALFALLIVLVLALALLLGTQQLTWPFAEKGQVFAGTGPA